MTTPVNLNRFRKDKARATKRATADANAVRFGRSKADKALDRARTDQAERGLDGHKVTDEPDA
ncbi:DUF4169 family protein [Salipiger aestuarii]|uniref:Uncharacterized protein DUF4169 n=1 Tax=Salipiger aestuarii TaxID=568098 RepID=A0A327XTQ0_9RHOB|nr:DUF4169 family protein [Salipiger aestuarii]EIE51082.1 hypothetical protein C357_10647 [Citreicella sp. 357]KAA8608639.1 amidase [Salipiger aestuarii]KAB2540637.1 amidase [Salipiger aestuarii]RAK11642.1 uncharacterized protein DUF4169 [Salipiger aestuarii]